MKVVDTNIIVFLLLQGERTDAARTLLTEDPDWRSDSFVLVEFSNVLATMVRIRSLALARARESLSQAEQIMESGLRATPHLDALTVANQFRVSVYDARYLAVAQAFGQRLITEDAKLRRAAPTLTQSLNAALAA
ncbi:MAG: type II toxin-antitoxin system VapC family toxin [Gammaproteobacteria bacterium]